MSSRFVKTILIVLLLLGITLPAFYCSTPNEEPELQEVHSSAWKNVYDSTVTYVGMEKCRTCHEPVYQTFIKTGMGQSWDVATKEKSSADFRADHSLVYDEELDFYYRPFWEDDTLYIMEYRLEGRDTIHKLVQQVNYIVGSGQHTNSHIFTVNGYAHQAPITYYTQKGTWDLAPGFEEGANSRFSRMIQLECMSCHNGLPEFESKSHNKYLTIKTGIDCERCHGPGSLHVQQKESGVIIDTSKGPDYTIVNPARLSTELQNNVCQRCHLQGIAVLNNDKTFFDFRPGMKLSEVMNVFMPQYVGGENKMIMASHVERMKKSDCYVNSGKMSCITCHNPHVSVKFTPQSQYINACKSCHAQQEDCTESLDVRLLKNDNCITCHMPKNGSIDIPHVAVTDHYIRRNPIAQEQQDSIKAFLGLVCYNNDNVSPFVKARGYMEFYERYNSEDKSLLDSALKYINTNTAQQAAQEKNKDLIRVYFLLNDFEQVKKSASDLTPSETNDAWTAYRIGEAYYQTGNATNAIEWYKRAVTIKPYALDFQNKYATALIAIGEKQQAKEVFEFILKEQPRYGVAHTNLGYMYMQEGLNTLAYDHLSKAILYEPDNKQALINIAIWYHLNNRDADAQKTLEHLLKKYPDNQQAKAMLLDLM